MNKCVGQNPRTDGSATRHSPGQAEQCQVLYESTVHVQYAAVRVQVLYSTNDVPGRQEVCGEVSCGSAGGYDLPSVASTFTQRLSNETRPEDENGTREASRTQSGCGVVWIHSRWSSLTQMTERTGAPRNHTISIHQHHTTSLISFAATQTSLARLAIHTICALPAVLRCWFPPAARTDLRVRGLCERFGCFGPAALRD